MYGHQIGWIAGTQNKVAACLTYFKVIVANNNKGFA